MDTRTEYSVGLLTLCEARNLDPTIDPDESVINCRCECGARLGNHVSAEVGKTIGDIRTFLVQARDFMEIDGILDQETRALMGAIDMNLDNAARNEVRSLLLATLCLGRLMERLLAYAGDIAGFRCRNKAKQQYYRFNAELCRDLIKTLELVADFRR
jgi:hypothetical protein